MCIRDSYYSVEEEPEMIYDTSLFAGSYSSTVVPYSRTANIFNEMAADASDFDPDTPVSYTHLDVYKRQGESNVLLNRINCEIFFNQIIFYIT